MNSNLYKSYETDLRNQTNEVKVFNNMEFGSIRTLNINNEPWFVAKDISDFLNYSDASAMTRHLDEDEKANCQIDSLSKSQIIINESGLYSAILRSKRPEAKKFKRWVTSEVLPTIRKTGGYIGNAQEMSEEEIMAKALMVAQRTIENKSKLIEELKPKAIFADAVSASQTSILVGELAKILKQNGINTGGTRLFSWLRENGYLIKRRGTDYNMPTQKSMDLGLFEIKETNVVHSDGHVSISKTPKVTGKGQVYFVSKFKSAKQLAN
ncbi:phage antirepressor KilAC domain-containing protein [Terrisporobacter glycolicus]|nr:phage antirepressor KilAC domain-containing protein [Terrisporobacter glycolicus]